MSILMYPFKAGVKQQWTALKGSVLNSMGGGGGGALELVAQRELIFVLISPTVYLVRVALQTPVRNPRAKSLIN